MKTPERIVSLISSGTEILYLLGLGDRVVGVSHECDYPADVANKPRLTRSLVESAATSRAIDEQVRSLTIEGSALYTIDVVLLESLAPEVIVTQSQCDVCAVRYEDVVSAVRGSPRLAQTRIVDLNPRSLGDVFDDIRRIGEATGAAQTAERVVARLAERVAAVRLRTADLAANLIPRVACLEWVDPPMLASNWMPELIRTAGGEPGLTAAGEHSSYASWSRIVAYDPQVVVIAPCGFALERAVVEAQVLLSWPGWSELSAVRTDRVFAADGNAYFNRSGPRLVDTLELLAHLFQPSRFTAARETRSAWARLRTDGERLLAQPTSQRESL